MTKFALYVPLQTKPDKEKEVADFLRGPGATHISTGRWRRLDGKGQGGRSVCQSAGDLQA